jgi:hypothetical protein
MDDLHVDKINLYFKSPSQHGEFLCRYGKHQHVSKVKLWNGLPSEPPYMLHTRSFKIKSK